MKQDERQYLLDAYEWNHHATFRLLHSGENDTYVVETANAKYALRRYRPGRYTLKQVRAELAWMDVLRGVIHVPEIIRNSSGEYISRMPNPTGESLYVVFEFVDGQSILNPTESDYQKLGRLMRSLHTNTDHIIHEVTSDWAGWNRPQYNIYYTVEEPLRCLLDFDALTSDDKERCVKIARELFHRSGTLDSTEHFIHADLHFGNILVTPDRWFCLDFDECGFGHRAIDIGVVRLHLHSAAQREKFWAHFKEGYGTQFSDEEIRIGTALRIFYMAGKIPLRQDIADLRRRPEDRIRRYLRWIESEIYTD